MKSSWCLCQRRARLKSHVSRKSKIRSWHMSSFRNSVVFINIDTKTQKSLSFVTTMTSLIQVGDILRVTSGESRSRHHLRVSYRIIFVSVIFEGVKDGRYHSSWTLVIFMTNTITWFSIIKRRFYFHYRNEVDWSYELTEGILRSLFRRSLFLITEVLCKTLTYDPSVN